MGSPERLRTPPLEPGKDFQPYATRAKRVPLFANSASDYNPAEPAEANHISPYIKFILLKTETIANQTSDYIKPSNIGSSEAHNRRTPEYLKHIAKENFYIRTDLMPQNSSWVSESLDGKDLTAYYNELARMVKEKTGRAMQTMEWTGASG